MKLINGECLEEMDKLIAEGIKVDAIITDPPYKIIGNGFKARGGSLGNRGIISDIEKIKDGFDFNILDRFFKITKKANFYIYANKDLLFDLIVYFKNRPEKLFIDLLTEHITNPTPFCNNTYLNDTDYILFIRESGVKVRGKYKNKCKYEIKSTNIKDKKEFGHPTCKYVGITEKYIINGSDEGDIILDPFMGSGTTGVACKNTNREFIGIELDKKYFNISKERIGKY